MKKIALLLALSLILGTLLVLSSCGGTRYTITEEEFEAIKTQNVTIKMEAYQRLNGETHSSKFIIKQSDGISCYCDNVTEGEDEDTSHSHVGGNSTVTSKQNSSIKSSGIDENVDVQGSDNSKMTRSAWSIGSVYTFEKGDIVDLPPDKVANNSGMTGTVLGSIIFNSVIFRPSIDIPVVDSDDLTEIGSSNWISQLTYIGSYKDSKNNVYKYNDFIVPGTVGNCVKTYNDKNYIEITVDDKNGESCVKWTEASDIVTTDAKFEDLVFNEKEKAYEYYVDDEENGMRMKAYLYFENGLLVKIIMFQSYFHDDVPYDVSKLTPSSSFVSENYTTSVYELYDHGETEIEGHSFSPDDIITKIKD